MFYSEEDFVEMEAKQFSEFAKTMVDYINDYLENIRDRYVRNTNIAEHTSSYEITLLILLT